MINKLIEQIKGKGVRIVFTEGNDARIQEAAVRLHKENIFSSYFIRRERGIVGIRKEKRI